MTPRGKAAGMSRCRRLQPTGTEYSGATSTQAEVVLDTPGTAQPKPGRAWEEVYPVK